MENQEPLVSIIVPLYNIGELICRCIRSVLDSNYQNIELLVVDDGSEDNSATLAEECIGDDPRGRIIRCEHRGVSKTRNTGIEIATGEYLIFLDHDDYIDSTKIKTLVEVAQQTNSQVIKCAIKRITIWGKEDTIKQFPTGWVDVKTVDYNSFDRSFITNALYKTSLIKDNDIRFFDCDMADDFFFNLTAITYAGGVYNIEEALTYYCKRSGSLSSAFKTIERGVSQDVMSRVERIKKCQKEMMEKLKNHPNYKYIERWLIGDLKKYDEYYLDESK